MPEKLRNVGNSYTHFYSKKYTDDPPEKTWRKSRAEFEFLRLCWATWRAA